MTDTASPSITAGKGSVVVRHIPYQAIGRIAVVMVVVASAACTDDGSDDSGRESQIPPNQSSVSAAASDEASVDELVQVNGRGR
ncbi:MAG TPA: hypothetical protein VFI59_16065 [Actinomycetota bacterium]|nr:hypothetical protein [Actinomycetota bacterium]